MEFGQSTDDAIRRWTAAGTRPGDRTDVWQAALAANYGHWQVMQAVDPAFEAEIRHRTIHGLRVVECVCDPCGGRRYAPLINRDPAPYVGVQITRSGRERFHVGDEVLSIGPGDLVIWTSDRPTEFTVTERLHKVSLVLPWSDLADRLPRQGRFTGTVIDSRHGIGAVLYSHIDRLARELGQLGDADHAAVRRATLELLAAAMSHRVDVPPRGLAARYLKQLQDYILANLQDDDLSPTRIATANNMSARYVHLLFGQTGVSVSAWIRAQRLQRCREDLDDPAYRDKPISDIGYAWGFKEPAHFSRSFKERFGVSPTDYRRGHRTRK